LKGELFMKKILIVIMSAVMAFMLFGCGTEKTNNNIEVYTPDGAPALALAKLMAEDMQFEKTVNYSVISASNIGATIAQKTADIALIPVNAASKLTADGSDYKMLSVNTHGNLFIIGTQAKTNLSDLKSEVLGVIGQALVPDLTLQYILKRDNIDYEKSDSKIEGKIALKYYAKADELIPAIKSGTIKFGLFPEPAMTIALSKISESQKLFDLQELWGSVSYPQAVLIAKTTLIESEPEFINSFLKAMEDNEEWLPLNIETAVNAINTNLVEGISPSLIADNITAEVIANCNIKVIKAQASKQTVIDYLTAIKTIADNSATLVSDNFFANI
jgi:NitT/TauT family transport system substrate-binding protein